jgi:hypothetical protein
LTDRFNVVLDKQNRSTDHRGTATKDDSTTDTNPRRAHGHDTKAYNPNGSSRTNKRGTKNSNSRTVKIAFNDVTITPIVMNLLHPPKNYSDH